MTSPCIFALVTALFFCLSQAQALQSLRILSVEQQKEALDFVLNKTIDSAYEAYDVQDFEALSPVATLYNRISTARPHSEFQFGLNQMLQELFHDAHFRVEVNEATASASYLGLNLCLEWLVGDFPSLVSTCETDYANIGKYDSHV